MRSRLHLTMMFVVCVQAIVFAEKAWPRKVVEPELRAVKTVLLPVGLRDALLRKDEITSGSSTLPDGFEVGRIDVNGDRINEFIVRSPESYSGGPHLLLYQQLKGKFVQIADLWGSVYFGPRVNGYFQIVSQSRGGAGAYVRNLEQFKSGGYRTVRAADYEEDGNCVLRFVRERSATNGFAPVRNP